jgi:hypothetical protein
MNIDNIPKHIKAMIQDRNLSMSQKFLIFTAYMPNMPTDPKIDELMLNNLETGKTIKRLVNEKKIRFGNLDKNFKLDIVTCDHDNLNNLMT